MSGIVIAGAGITGLALARALQAGGSFVEVFDARTQDVVSEVRNPGVRRALSMTPGSIAWLEQLGCWPAEAASEFSGMQVWDGQGTAVLEFPATGAVVPSDALVAALGDGLAVRYDTRLASLSPPHSDDESVELSFSDDRQQDCELLVGADGGESLVREIAGLRTVGWRYDQEAVVATVDVAQAHGSIARQCFTAQGPLAFLPLQDSHRCSVIWSSRDAAALLALDEEAFCAALTQQASRYLGRVTASSPRASFPLRQQHALAYVSRGIALLGDAAHTIHPLAGQGANLGLGDARALSQRILEGRLEGRAPGSLELLRGYQRARQPHNLAVATLMEALKQAFAPLPGGLTYLRNAGMRLVNQQDWLKAQMVALASR